mmetsp:Transcript_13460/g.26426  ORF Transcript_13460/g.26426 Transcript_13460/m.26426 type:complete len:369 (+) Transcript_13460:553-1659(+)
MYRFPVFGVDRYPAWPGHLIEQNPSKAFAFWLTFLGGTVQVRGDDIDDGRDVVHVLVLACLPDLGVQLPPVYRECSCIHLRDWLSLRVCPLEPACAAAAFEVQGQQAIDFLHFESTILGQQAPQEADGFVDGIHERKAPLAVVACERGNLVAPIDVNDRHYHSSPSGSRGCLVPDHVLLDSFGPELSVIQTTAVPCLKIPTEWSDGHALRRLLIRAGCARAGGARGFECATARPGALRTRRDVRTGRSQTLAFSRRCLFRCLFNDNLPSRHILKNPNRVGVRHCARPPRALVRRERSPPGVDVSVAMGEMLEAQDSSRMVGLLIPVICHPTDVRVPFAVPITPRAKREKRELERRGNFGAAAVDLTLP